MSQRFILPKYQFFSNLGYIGSGYKLYFYEAGSVSTDKTVYKDSALTIPHSQPVLTDANGRITEDIFYSDASAYKLVIKDNSGNLLDTADPIQEPVVISLNTLEVRPSTFWGITSGTSSAYTLSPNPTIVSYTNNLTFDFSPHVANAAGSTINVSSQGTLALKKETLDGVLVNIEANDLLPNGVYHAWINGSVCVVQNPAKPLLHAYQDRCAISVGSSVTKVSISAGSVVFQDRSSSYASSIIEKDLAASWAAGNSGGLLSGVKAINSTYHVFRIYNPTTQTMDAAFLLGVAGTAPDPTASLPSGYTKYERVGSVTTDGSGNIRPWSQCGRYFEYTQNVLEYSGTIASGETLRTMVSLPLGIITRAIAVMGGEITAGGVDHAVIKLYSANITTGTIYNRNNMAYMINGQFTGANYAEALTNASGQIKHNKANIIGTPTVSADIFIHGFIDIGLR